MARNDFIKTIEQLNGQYGILRIAKDFYMQPRQRGSTWFVKSPATRDKNWSCALNPETNRFTDFANGGTGGDTVKFISYTSGIDNWTALKLLREFYSLPNSQEVSREDIRRQIYLDQQAEKKRQSRQKEFKQALYGQISLLKETEDNYKVLFQQEEVRANSNVVDWLLGELGEISMKLDVLCGVSSAYRRMKSSPEKGLPSDQPQWLLDVLRVLKDEGVFEATAEELKKIQSQAEFEAKRKPGVDRRCRFE